MNESVAVPLNDRQIKNLKPQSKDYWVVDEKCLRLLVKVNGSKYWRMSYRFGGKQKSLALGVYPDVSLKDARLKRDRARLQVADGIDPGIEKKALRKGVPFEDSDKFSTLALEWWNVQKNNWTEKYADRLLHRMQVNSFPLLDSKSIANIEPPDVLQVVRQIEARGSLDVAKRVLQCITAVFRYGVQTGRLKYNPAFDMAGVIKSHKPKHRDSLPNKQLGSFLAELDDYHKQGRLLTQLGLQLLILTFVRSGELRSAEWSDFEIENAQWRIPPKKMKMETEHLLPLSRQSLKILEQLRPITGHQKLLFPCETNPQKLMSDNTMRRAMFRLGYDGNTEGKAKATPHGFRANASSILNEQGFNPDAIERQLSHLERNKVRGAYSHHAHYMDDRGVMMQWWADHLDKLKQQSKYS